jgi:hypothetical protein
VTEGKAVRGHIDDIKIESDGVKKSVSCEINVCIVAFETLVYLRSL